MTRSLTGASLIAAERVRQVQAEGRTVEHDRGHGGRPLVHAGQAYLWGQAARWPWPDGWKPKNRLSDLVRAGALFQAALDTRADDFDGEYAEARRDECAGLIDELLAEFHARAAAIAADPSPAEEAVKRVEALEKEWMKARDHDEALHGAVDTAARIFRAALASPAPAPQGGEPTCYCGRLGHRLGGPILHKRTEECPR